MTERTHMSKQGNRTPGRTDIAATAAGAGLAFGGAWWIAVGMSTLRETAGFLAAGVLCMLLLCWAFQQVADRGDRPLVRMLDEARRQENTGTWGSGQEGPPRAVTTVRWDPEEKIFYVSGWISDYYMITGEKPWHDLGTLKTVISEIEADGLEPGLDPGTVSVRRRLGLLRSVR
jgi:hypothetical protein